MSGTDTPTRQIRDGAVTNAKVAADAAIATTKLADSANFILRDGSVPFTGSTDHGNQRITNVGTPTAASDATTKGYVDGLIDGLSSLFDSKPSARAASTADVTVSNPGTSSFDGVTLSADDRLMLRAQSDPAENGLYTFNGSGSALTRIPEMDEWDEVPGALVVVEEGSTYADTLWLCTSNQGGTIGTTDIVWYQIPFSAGSVTFVDKQVPSGSINGSNTTFTLGSSPVSGSEHLYLNGILQESGAGNDYTISGTTITMAIAPISGDKLAASYRV